MKGLYCKLNAQFHLLCVFISLSFDGEKKEKRILEIIWHT